MKKARSQKLKKFNKVLSVLLAAAMVAGSVPDVSLVAHATEAETEAAEETSFLSEENAGTADAVSESTSEEVSTAEEQQSSEEAVPTEEEVSEEAVSTQETSSTEENKESESTSDTVETESVDASEDNTTGEEVVETAPVETETVSTEAETENVPVETETISEEIVEDEGIAVLADPITVTENKEGVTSTIEYAVADAAATSLDQFKDNSLTYGNKPESITPDTPAEGEEAKNKFLYIKVTEAENKAVTLKNGASGSEQEVTGAVTDTENTKIKYYCIEVVNADAVTLTFTEENTETPPAEATKHNLSVSVVNAAGEEVTNGATIKTGDTDSAINDIYNNAPVEVEENADKYIEVTAGAGYEVVSVMNGEDALTPVEGKENIYKITMGTEDIAITVTVKKVYTITVPESITNATNYKLSVKKGSAAATTPAEVTAENAATTGLSAGDTVTVTFDVTIDADKETEVTYTIGGKSEVVEPKSTADGKASYEIVFTVDTEEAADVTVSAITVTQSDLYALSLSDSTTGVTAKYLAVPASKPTEVKVADFKDLAANTKVKAGNYYILLSAAGKVIDTVTYGDSNTEAEKVIVDNTVVYKVTVSNAAVAVSATTADTVSVPVTKGSNVKAVYYTTEAVTAYDKDKFLEATESTIVVKKDSTIKLYVEYDNHYTVDTVTINGTDAESPTKTTLFELATNATLEEGKTLGFAVTAKHITVTYTVSALADKDDTAEGVQTKGNITFDKTNIISYQPAGADAPITDIPADGVVVTDKETTIVVNEGDKVTYRLTADTGYEASATGVDAQKRADADGNVYYTFTAEAAATIATTITAIAPKTVTFNNDEASHIKSVMTFVGEATEGSAVTFADDKTTTPDYGKAFSFTIPAESIDAGYVVDYVAYSTNADDENPIWAVKEATEGKYVFENGITENTTIKLVEKLDPEKVNTVTVTFDSAYAKVEQVESASDSNDGTVVDSEKPVQVLGQFAYIRVTPTTGYKASVKVADAEAEDIKAAKVYTIDFGADAVKISKAVTVTSAIDDSITVEGKRYVKFENTNEVPFEIKEAAGIKKIDTDETTVYEIDGAAVKEVEFTVTVPDTKEYQYTPASPVIKVAEKTENGNTVYTYKIVVSQIASSAVDAEKAEEITLGSIQGIKATITFEGAYNKGVSKVVINDERKSKDKEINAVAGDKVVIALEDNYELYEVGENDPITNEPNETKLDLDYYNMYTYTAKEEKTFKVVGAETKYTTTINGKEVSEIEAKNGDEVSIQVLNESSTPLAITKVDFGEAASRYAVSEDKNTVKVTVSADDAGKTITAKLYADVNIGTESDEILSEKLVGEAKIKVSPLAAGVTVKNGKTNIKNNATVKLDGLKEVSYDLTFTPAGVEPSYFEAKVEEGKKVEATIKGSKLEIATGAEDEEAKVTIVDKNKTEGNVLFTMTVKTSKPALKVTKVESASAGMKDINLTLTGDKAISQNMKTGTYAYYKIVAVPAETSKVGEAKPAGAASYTYYVPYDTTASYNAVVNDAADIKKAAWTYDFTVSVVIAENSVAAGTTAPATILAESKTAVKKSFTTRNAYYEDKLGLKKKTTNIFNGQQNVVAATVSFSKNASYIESADVAVIDKDGVTVSGIEGIVDTTTGEVKISVDSSIAAGKYTAIVSAIAKTEPVDQTENVQTMYRASANLPITVKASQYNFYHNAPAKLAMGAKDVNFALKITAYDNNGTKSAVQKFGYELVSSTGAELNTAVKTEKNIKDNVIVNPKNGKITIKKTFKCSADPADNVFGVKVTAADWDENEARGVIRIEVTNKAMAIGKMYLVDEDGEPFSGEISVGSELELVVEDTEGNDITDYVTFTPAYKEGKNSVGYDNYRTPYFFAYKPAKNLAIKATTTDGGKKSATLKVNVAYKKFTQMSYTLLYSSVGIDEVSANSYEYKSINGGHFGIRVEDIIDGIRHDTVPSDYNYKVTVKGGTMTSGYVWDEGEYKYTYEITPNAEVTTISIKNPEVRTPAVITLKNLAFVKTAAPKATTKDKLYMNNVNADGRTIVQNMTYTVAKGTYDYVNVVYVSGDYVVKEETLAIGNDNTFTVSTPNNAGFTKALTGKYTFTYGKVENNEFVPQTKPANVTIKVNKSAEFKPTASYTITPTDSTVVALAGKPNEVINSFDGVQFSDLQNANVKGQPNKFRDIFTLNEVNGTLVLNTAAANLNELLADKNNLTGYVTYQYRKYSNGSWKPVTKITKITVKVDAKDKKYKADAVDILKGTSSTSVVTTVRLNKDAVALLENGAVIADAASGWTAAVANADDAANGKVTLTAASPTPGKNKVQFKIIPRNSSVVLADLAAKGITVEATVNVLDPTVYAKKLTVKKGATVIDLANAAKSYDTQKKTGVFTYTVSPLNVYTLVNGAAVKATGGMTAAEGTKEGYGIKLDENGNIVITANANAVEKGKSYTLTATVSFENGVDETIKFTVKAPKTIADVASVKAAVDAYLAAFAASGSDVTAQNADAATIKAELESDVIDPITGITVKTVTPVYTAAQDAAGGNPAVPASYKVTVVLTDPNPAEGAAADIEFKDVVVKEPAQAQDLAAAKAAVQALVDKIVGEKSANEETAKTEKLATELTSSLALRAYLITAITNPDIMLEISSFRYVAPIDGTAENQKGKDGSLTFTCKVFTQTEASGEIKPQTNSIKIPAKEYTAPSGN